MKKTYSQKEMIKLLVTERTRARNIAYMFKKKYDNEVEALKSLELRDSRSAHMLAMTAKHKSNIARQIGNSISGSTDISPSDETIEDRIKEELK